MKFKILLVCLIASVQSNAQNLDMEEGFYEILEKGRENSRQMLLRGDSSLIYFVSEQPVVSKRDRLVSEAAEDSNSLYFFHNERGTKRLLEFTTDHVGGKVGFVYLGSLRAIYIIEEIVDNGVIELTSNRIYKINRRPPDSEK